MKERVYFYDNLKFILIVLVTIGHFLLCLETISLNAKTVILWIYSFHMPLFIFITGFLSKKLTEADGGFRLNKVLNLFILYIIFKFLAHFITVGIFHEPVSFALFIENECPWYILALCIWMVLTFIFNRIKPNYLLCGSIAVSLLIGFDDTITTYFSISRVIVFYPFFLIGYYLSKDNMKKLLDKINKKSIKIASILILICVFLICFAFVDKIYCIKSFFTGQVPYLYASTPYDFLASDMFTRGFCYIISLILGIAVMSLVPHKKTFFTNFGSRTLQIYILHYLFMLVLMYSPLNELFISIFKEWTFVFYIFLGIIISFLTGLKLFEYPFKKIMKLDYSFMYR